MQGATTEARSSSSAYPLVDATVDFLREFVEKAEERERGKSNVTANGSSSSSMRGGGGGGKGKERDATGGVGIGTRGGWNGADPELFLPTYIYDAMEAKKRIDSMQVSFFCFYFYFIFLWG